MTETSKKRLSECHPDLILLITEVNKIYPIQVICGQRGEVEQNKAFAEKKSKLKFPESKHNKSPSLAVDIIPDPDFNPKTVDWNQIEAFKVMLFAVELVAKRLKIKIRLGRDFSFKDYPHVELQ
jgi:peptidoglycan L-alanyl-D-glutamate endopeptidase CwlK